ncbi:MAG TPA: hypothetical protein VMT85_08215 [Thermoanaerobaculia bacterium]|nr:hypothetical protein [Thermoanaerobaculia bacterium]
MRRWRPDTEVEISIAVSTIVGIVRNTATGDPVPGVLVVAHPPGGNDHARTPVARSAEDGTFVLEDLVEGEWAGPRAGSARPGAGGSGAGRVPGGRDPRRLGTQAGYADGEGSRRSLTRGWLWGGSSRPSRLP